jgi:rRNA processing protein Gar1
VEPDALDIVVADDEPIELLGHIMHILDGTCVIRSAAGRPALDLDSVLCLEDRKLIGRVFETFGQVSDPFYSVLIASEAKKKEKKPTQKTTAPQEAPSAAGVVAEEEQKLVTPAAPTVEGVAAESTTEPPKENEPTLEQVPAPANVPDIEVTGSLLTDSILEPKIAALSDLKLGMEVFFVKAHASMVHPEKLYAPGYDASNEFDEEVPEDVRFMLWLMLSPFAFPERRLCGCVATRFLRRRKGNGSQEGEEEAQYQQSRC